MRERRRGGGSSAPAAGSWRRALGVGAASLLVPILPFALLGELPGERWLSARDTNAPAFATLGTLLLALDVVLPIPSSVIGVMLGGRLGVVLGFVCCLFGLVAGHSVGYGLGRLAPERWAAQPPAAPRWLAVFSSRAVPVLAEAIAVAAGATRMPWWQFIAAALVGDTLYAAALAATGAALLPQGWYLTALLLPVAIGVVAGAVSWHLRPARRAGRGGAA